VIGAVYSALVLLLREWIVAHEKTRILLPHLPGASQPLDVLETLFRQIGIFLGDLADLPRAMGFLILALILTFSIRSWRFARARSAPSDAFWRRWSIIFLLSSYFWIFTLSLAHPPVLWGAVSRGYYFPSWTVMFLVTIALFARKYLAEAGRWELLLLWTVVIAGNLYGFQITAQKHWDGDGGRAISENLRTTGQVPDLPKIQRFVRLAGIE
jgi:hypothetical protein